MHGFFKNRALTVHGFFQVTTGLSDPEVRNREIEGLMEAMNTYHLQEGIILTENEQDTIKMNEFVISVIPIWKWLLFQ